jgi:hypothetical protein
MRWRNRAFLSVAIKRRLAQCARPRISYFPAQN